MAVRIEARTDRRLQLTGDIETILHIPTRSGTDSFSLAFSDGTLVQGSYRDGIDACHFAIATEGSAVTRIARHDGCDVLDLDWNFDWITLAGETETLRSKASEHDNGVLQLALDMALEDQT